MCICVYGKGGRNRRGCALISQPASYRSRGMFISPDDEPFEGKHMKKSLQNLGESIQSLLGSKTDLTFTWAESVRLIIEDLSSATNSPDSPSSPACFTDAKLSEKEKRDLQAAISKLEDELAALTVYLRQLDNKRRETLSKFLDLKGNIRVFCRVRPFLLSEKRAHPGPLVVPGSDKVVIKLPGGKPKEYNFDKVFLPEASQDDVFAEVEPIIRSALDGHNVCIFAYGQTGTGKTFTMEGKAECPGVVPHTIQEVFRLASLDSTVTFTFTFSMLELYMGCLRDLLAPRPTKLAEPSSKCLSIQMDAKGTVEVENLREIMVTNFDQASRLYGIGSRARSTAWTNVNESSSRSHCLIRIAISCSGAPDRYRDTSKLWMVDLGGSERLLKTQATGRTMEEGKAINMSLSALGDVISALQRKQAHVPYRNSKLTQILRDSVGADSKTLMLVHISPKEDDLGETICSLGFAARARGIHLGRELSSELKAYRAATMVELMQQMRCLEDDCQSTRNNIHTVEFLLREKRKHLAKSDPSIEHPETPQSRAGQESEAKKIESGNVAQGSVGLPRFMNSTVCSRIRGMTDVGCKSPITSKRREKVNNTERRKSSLGNSKTVALQFDSQWNVSKVNGAYSKQCTIPESQYFWECTSPKDSTPERSSMPHCKRITALQVPPGKTLNKKVSANNTMEEADLTLNKKEPNKDSGDDEKGYDHNPSGLHIQSSKKLYVSALSRHNAKIFAGENKTQESQSKKTAAATTTTKVPNTVAGDFQARKTSKNRKRLTLECRISFNRERIS